ncbi:MAG: hypothetical protein IT373_08215 [Polyangiaceae bacterium]|nr:hypothetical protein [Polyangiaceae bacterium]
MHRTTLGSARARLASIALGLALAATACAARTTTRADTADAGGAGGAGGGAGGADGLGGSFGFGGGAFVPTAVRDLPGLASITFYERTGGEAPTAYDFAVDGAELGTRLPDPLGPDALDIPGAPTEYYDVYYSDQEGNFALDGSYLTISGAFGQGLPWGGGLNLAEIGLHYSDESVEYGNYVASFVTVGDNADPVSVTACIDGDLDTNTTMGNTLGGGERLRLTLGFASTSGPPN